MYVVRVIQGNHGKFENFINFDGFGSVIKLILITVYFFDLITAYLDLVGCPSIYGDCWM